MYGHVDVRGLRVVEERRRHRDDRGGEQSGAAPERARAADARGRDDAGSHRDADQPRQHDQQRVRPGTVEGQAMQELEQEQRAPRHAQHIEMHRRIGVEPAVREMLRQRPEDVLRLQLDRHPAAGQAPLDAGRFRTSDAIRIQRSDRPVAGAVERGANARQSRGGGERGERHEQADPDPFAQPRARPRALRAPSAARCREPCAAAAPTPALLRQRRRSRAQRSIERTVSAGCSCSISIGCEPAVRWTGPPPAVRR